MIKEFSIVHRASLTFFFAINMFGFIFQIHYYIIEKEWKKNQNSVIKQNVFWNYVRKTLNQNFC